MFLLFFVLLWVFCVHVVAVLTCVFMYGFVSVCGCYIPLCGGFESFLVVLCFYVEILVPFSGVFVTFSVFFVFIVLIMCLFVVVLCFYVEILVPFCGVFVTFNAFFVC